MLESLTGWDWFVAVVVVLSVGVGMLRGLVRTLFALGAWIGGLIGAPVAGALLLPQIGGTVPAWVVYLLAYVALFVAIRLVGAVAVKALHGLGLGGLDRLLGGVLGVARGLLLVLLVAVGAHLLGLSRGPAWQQALSRPVLDAMIGWAEPFLPERITGIRRT